MSIVIPFLLAFAVLSLKPPELMTIRAVASGIPVLIVSPTKTKGKSLVIWLTGFGGSKESVHNQLVELAKSGYVALSFDPHQHGERRIETNPDLVKRVRGNIRRYFWPILAKSAEESEIIIDWAIKELGVRKLVAMGGVSMGGDIAVAAAGVDRRIKVVSAVVATPDWMRPGSFEPPGEPDSAAQEHFNRRNPLTNLHAYAHRPYIAFQSGADDKQVPPDGGQRFKESLRDLYGRELPRLQVNLQPGTPHSFTPEMWANSLKWFRSHLPP